jgi:hypothetical protein
MPQGTTVRLRRDEVQNLAERGEHSMAGSESQANRRLLGLAFEVP